MAIAELEELLHTGPFHTALRAAIEARGLTLERLQDHLAALGVSVSVSSLSKWQRGTGRPERPHTLLAVSRLEQALRLPPNSLRLLLEDQSACGRRVQSSPSGSLAAVSRLRAQLDAPTKPTLTVLSVHEDLAIGETMDDRVLSTRIVIQALQSGLNRCVLVVHQQDTTLTTFQPGRTCTMGRVRTDPAEGLVGAEMMFGPLAQGETYPLEYSVRISTPDTYYDRWFPSAGQHYDLTIRFPAQHQVHTVRRIWRLDAGSPHKDVSELRLVDGCLTHLIDRDLTVGYHGIRWQ